MSSNVAAQPNRRPQQSVHPDAIAAQASLPGFQRADEIGNEPWPSRPQCGVYVQVYTTTGYAHVADAHLVDAVEKVGNLTAQAMAAGTASPDGFGGNWW